MYLEGIVSPAPRRGRPRPVRGRDPHGASGPARRSCGRSCSRAGGTRRSTPPPRSASSPTGRRTSLDPGRAGRRPARRPAGRREPQGLAGRRADRHPEAARQRPRRRLPRHGQQHRAAGRPDGGRRGAGPLGLHDPPQGHGRRGIRARVPARRGPARRRASSTCPASSGRSARRSPRSASTWR